MAEPTGVRTADSVNDGVASTMDNLTDMASRAKNEASRVATRTSERASALGQQAAERLGETASYFRDHEMKEIVSDLKSYTKSHPGQALLGAAAVGFLAAVLLRRS